MGQFRMKKVGQFAMKIVDHYRLKLLGQDGRFIQHLYLNFDLLIGLLLLG